MTVPRRLYLAGPDVFAPDPRELGGRRRALCEKYGFEGLFPLDWAIDLKAQAPAATAERSPVSESGPMNARPTNSIRTSPGLTYSSMIAGRLSSAHCAQKGHQCDFAS